MANAIVASMLPDGVVKGDSAIKMRFGDMSTRFTTDLDTATASDPDEYARLLGEALARGWEGFGGRVVPTEYVMRSFDVKLTYMGKSWCSVPLEVGHNEVGDADSTDWVDLADAATLFVQVCLPAPGRAPLMPLDHQVAQKLHALTGPGNRARDLVDLQLIAANAELNFVATR